MKNRFVTVVACALLGALAAVLAGQAPSGYDLTLVDMGGTQKILNRLPASVYAPRVSPDGRQVAFETRDPKARMAGGCGLPTSRTSRIPVRSRARARR